MDGMRIEIHEWPLPSAEHHVKTVLFELYCPKPFLHWREATYFILRDTFTRRVDEKSSVNDDLASYMRENISYDGGSNRITLASITKSWLRTHYNPKRIPSTPSDVCLSHALKWRLYDDKHDLLINENDSPHEADVLRDAPFSSHAMTPISSCNGL